MTLYRIALSTWFTFPLSSGTNAWSLLFCLVCIVYSSVYVGGGVFLGAVGDPRFDKLPVDKRPEKGLLRIRTELNAYQNIRPVYVAPELADASSIREDIVKGTDFVIMRELCGDIYTYHHELHDSYAKDVMHYSVPEIERIARAAGHLARKRKKFVTSIGKWNVLACSQLWKRVVDEVFAKEFPDIKLEHQLVDSAAFKILKNPRAYYVILMPNMFGDILSDEAAALMASLGMLSSASISDPGMPGFYEPAHASAPDIAGKDICNPYGSILSAAMMLRYQFEMDREADVVERACYQAIREGYVTPDIARGKKPKSTKECGKYVAELVGRPMLFCTLNRLKQLYSRALRFLYICPYVLPLSVCVLVRESVCV